MKLIDLNDDLTGLIASYLPPLDLLQLEAVNRYWRNRALLHYPSYLSSTNIHYLTYKKNSFFKSNKHRACYMQKRQFRKTDSFLLTGGSFGSPAHVGYILEFIAQNNNHSNNNNDSPMLKITGKRTGAFQSENGCHAVAVDNANQLYVFGGYESADHTAHIDTWRLNMQTKIRRSYDNEKRVYSFPRRNCFAAATSLIDGEIVISGGCDGPFQGSTVYSEAFLLPPTTQESINDLLQPLPSMRFPRGGHSLITLLSNHVVCVGGYGGGLTYYREGEMLDIQTGQWLPIPSMRFPRSGFATCLSPLGGVVAAGGSVDGTVGLRAVEMWDPRQKTWHSLPPMTRPRGYTGGGLGSSGCFYVLGGLHAGKFQAGVEVFDFRGGRWREPYEAEEVAGSEGTGEETSAGNNGNADIYDNIVEIEGGWQLATSGRELLMHKEDAWEDVAHWVDFPPPQMRVHGVVEQGVELELLRTCHHLTPLL
eukprot:gene29502-35607_t